MCELMGMSFKEPISADFSMRVFAMRDAENADGWGLAWYSDPSVSLVKEAIEWRKSAYTQFLETYQRLESRIYIAHVRHKSVGGIATHADTHPFTREWAGQEFCFAHNGTVHDFHGLRLGRFHPIGSTDSEHIFCHLLNELAEHGMRLNDPTTWTWLHGRLVTWNKLGTINCLLSDGQMLICYHDATAWKGLSLRKVRIGEQGERHFGDVTIGVGMESDVANHGFVVATRPLSETGWHSFQPGEMVVLEHGKLRYSSHPR